MSKASNTRDVMHIGFPSHLSDAATRDRRPANFRALSEAFKALTVVSLGGTASFALAQSNADLSGSDTPVEAAQPSGVVVDIARGTALGSRTPGEARHVYWASPSISVARTSVGTVADSDAETVLKSGILRGLTAGTQSFESKEVVSYDRRSNARVTMRASIGSVWREDRANARNRATAESSNHIASSLKDIKSANVNGRMVTYTRHSSRINASSRQASKRPLTAFHSRSARPKQATRVAAASLAGLTEGRVLPRLTTITPDVDSTTATSETQRYAATLHVANPMPAAQNTDLTNSAYVDVRSSRGPALATGTNSIALGGNALASANDAVALGADSVADRDRSVSVGSAGHERQITNVAAGTASTDAVNYGQLTSSMSGLNARIDDVDRFARRGIAAASALNIVTPYLPGRTTVNAALANYRGQAALGVGVSRWNSKGTVNYNLAVSTAGSNSTIVRVGLGIVLAT